MSETLSDPALGDHVAAPSVEDQAPAEVAEVDVASAPTSEPQDFVPKSRFNGLMSSYNRTQNELQAAQARLAALEAQLAEKPEQEMPVTDVSGLEAKVNDLAALLIEQQMENARLKALEEFPEAKPFADLINASTPTEIRQVAEAIAQRVRAAGGTEAEAQAAAGAAVEVAEAAAEETTTEAPEVPVVAGGTTYDSQVLPSEAVQDAIAKKDFASYLAAKRAARALTTP